MTSLSVRGLSKAFGRTPVLRDLDLEVAEGELLAVLGQSGSGKTTLLRVLAGFAVADAGEIRFGATEVLVAGRSLPPHRRRVGFLPQEGALFPHLNVAANIGFGLPRSQRRSSARVGELLPLVGLGPEYASRWPHELSGGQQQRVALARALAPEPSLVLLDEPFSSLDAALRAETRATVATALRTTGATALLVTHDRGEALSMADRVAVMHSGRILQIGTPRQVYDTPVDAAVARLTGEAVLLPGDAGGATAGTLLGRLGLREQRHGPVTVLVRPEQITIVAAEAGTAPARVERIAYYGHDATVELGAVADALRPDGHRLMIRCREELLPEVGAQVHLAVTGRAHAFAVTGGEPEVPAAPSGEAAGRVLG